MGALILICGQCGNHELAGGEIADMLDSALLRELVSRNLKCDACGSAEVDVIRDQPGAAVIVEEMDFFSESPAAARLRRAP